MSEEGQRISFQEPWLAVDDIRVSSNFCDLGESVCVSVCVCVCVCVVCVCERERESVIRVSSNFCDLRERETVCVSE